jgi:hypothetical protein
MEEREAEAVAAALGGEPWQSGGDIWLVIRHRADGHMVVISDDAVCEYQDEKAFEQGNTLLSILLA